MKPSTLTAMALCLAMKGFAQSAPPNQSLISTEFVSAIQPATSQGYLYWKEVPNAVYKVNLYKKMGSNFIFTTALNSNKNYLKLSSDVLAGKNMYYELIALNHLNGNTLLIGEKTPIENKYKSGDDPLVGVDYELDCIKQCNGSDYAYQLSIYRPTSNATPSFGFMQIETTYENSVNGSFTPFYLAISQADYDLLDPYHPWKEQIYIANVLTDLYHKIQILPNSNNGPYYDKNGILVNSGWLIEKKPNAFARMLGSKTVSEPDQFFCFNTPQYSWLTFYNASSDLNYSSYNYFNYISTINPEVLGLTCDQPGWQKPIKPILPKPEKPILDFDHNYTSFKDCIDKSQAIYGSSEWWDCWNRFFDYMPSDKPYVTGIDVKPIDLNNNNAANFRLLIDKIKGNYLLRSNKFESGLYYVDYIYSNGEIYNSIEELNFPDNFILNRDKVQVKISPNKIENNLINLDLNALDNVCFKLEIIDLAGALIHSEQIDMKKEEQLNKKIAVSSANVAYNQLRLNLLFEDGSSIQQTILK